MRYPCTSLPQKQEKSGQNLKWPSSCWCKRHQLSSLGLLWPVCGWASRGFWVWELWLWFNKPRTRTDELVSPDTASPSDGAESAIHLGPLIQTRRCTLPPWPCGGAASANSFPLDQQIGVPEPMKLGCTSLSQEEEKHHHRSDLCLVD